MIQKGLRYMYLTLALFATLCGYCIAYRTGDFIVGTNRRLVGHSMTLTKAMSAVDCSGQCLADDTCLAANYNPTTGDCELCDETPVKYGSKVQANASWNMYHEKGPCNESWIYYGSSCYWLEPTTATWSTSTGLCEDLGARLVEVNDQQENDFIHEVYLDANLPKNLWLGANDISVEGKFVWPSGAPMSFMNFGANEGIWNHEDCVSMGQQGTWGDLVCSRLEHSMCEKPATYGA